MEIVVVLSPPCNVPSAPASFTTVVFAASSWSFMSSDAAAMIELKLLIVFQRVLGLWGNWLLPRLVIAAGQAVP